MVQLLSTWLQEFASPGTPVSSLISLPITCTWYDLEGLKFISQFDYYMMPSLNEVSILFYKGACNQFQPGLEVRFLALLSPGLRWQFNEIWTSAKKLLLQTFHFWLTRWGITIKLYCLQWYKAILVKQIITVASRVMQGMGIVHLKCKNHSWHVRESCILSL